MVNWFLGFIFYNIFVLFVFFVMMNKVVFEFCGIDFDFLSSVIIYCFGKVGKVSEVLKFFEEMVECGFVFSFVIYNIIIDL